MILGRTPEGLIKIKKDDPLGLRAVNCACCAQPGCCPYPSQALVDGLYTYEDLPDAIDIDSIEFTKLDPPQFIGGVTQYYINSDGEYLGIEDQTPDSIWAYEGGNNACLLNDAGWEDQFADTYTVSGGPLGAITVTRVSLCLWTGLDSCGNTASLELNEDISNGKLWSVNVPNYILPCVVFDVLQGENIGFGNTPVGSYGNFPYEEGFLFVS